MTIDMFIEYAKVIRKYKPILNEYKYHIDIYENMLSLYSNCNCITIIEGDKMYFTPGDLDEHIKRELITNKRNEITQRIKELQKEQKRLEIVLKTIDNAN